MMFSTEQIIAKKYATALLNLYFDIMKPECLDTLLALNDFFKNNQLFMHYLCIPTIPDHIKATMLEKVFKKLNVCNTVKMLISPLLKQRRISLIDKILAQLIKLYQERAGVIPFNISTSHELSKDEQHDIIMFLATESGKKIAATFSIDTTLLCGFRAQSKTLIFEKSLVKKIRSAQTSFYERIKL